MLTQACVYLPWDVQERLEQLQRILAWAELYVYIAQVTGFARKASLAKKSKEMLLIVHDMHSCLQLPVLRYCSGDIHQTLQDSLTE